MSTQPMRNFPSNEFTLFETVFAANVFTLGSAFVRKVIVYSSSVAREGQIFQQIWPEFSMKEMAVSGTILGICFYGISFLPVRKIKLQFLVSVGIAALGTEFLFGPGLFLPQRIEALAPIACFFCAWYIADIAYTYFNSIIKRFI